MRCCSTGIFLETHIERHPLGFTTNHTLSDYAGLAVLGRLFAATPVGERWRALATEGMSDCLDTQVIAGGGHAEASLPYERFVLEAALVTARCLDPDQAEPLRRGIHALARHLRAATLASGLPFVGDGDDSFFPPFACTPHEAWDPLDPEPVLHVAAGWCGDDRLRGDCPAGPAAHWLSLDAPAAPRDAAPVAEDPEFPAGFHRFSAGPLVGILIHRDGASGWLPTHGHNDLLGLLLEIDGAPLLIDPGTGAYGLDPRLRHTLRATAAHSTLQLDECEQSRIDLPRLFEGPPAVAGGLIRPAMAPAPATSAGGSPGDESAASAGLPLEAWHEGFGKGFRHLRRISHQEGILWIEDRLGDSGRGAGGAVLAPREDHRTTLRFRIAPGLILRGLDPEVPLDQLALPVLQKGKAPENLDLLEVTSASRACVEIAGREIEFLLLRPARALWQIGSGAISRRYGSRQEGPILQAQFSGPLPHRWLTGIRYRPRS